MYIICIYIYIYKCMYVHFIIQLNSIVCCCYTLTPQPNHHVPRATWLILHELNTAIIRSSAKVKHVLCKSDTCFIQSND